MTPAGKPLRRAVRVLSALGLLSLSLTGEVGPAWLAGGWGAWLLSFITDHAPETQALLRRFETVAVIAMVGVLGLDFFGLRYSIFLAMTHFLLLFQIFKLLGEKTRKDCVQIFLFAFFQILAACTLSVDVWHAGVLLILIPVATAALFWNHVERELERAPQALQPPVGRRYQRLANVMCGSALPVNLALTTVVFLVFPRLTLNAPLPGFGTARTGYTDQVNLAQKGALQQNASAVLWLNIPNSEQRRQWNGYLRGEVLSAFDGKQWSVARDASPRILLPATHGVFAIERPKPGAQILRQMVTLIDTTGSTLFVASTPLQILAPLPALQQNASGGLHWLATWRRPLRYEVLSDLQNQGLLSRPTPPDLELPKIPLQRLAALARQVGGSATPAKQAKTLEAYLRDHYRYSMDFGETVVDNPVDSFLFERRQGPCGHFASAMALMLRVQGIPSRLVAGYLKGEWNEPAQQFLVRERDAHAWVEAYLPGKGWVPFDPSPRQAASVGSQKWTHGLQQYWDYLGFKWNKLVIQYDLYAQLRAFENIRGSSDRMGAFLSDWWAKNRHRFSSSHHPPSSGTEGMPLHFSHKTGAWILLAAAAGAFAWVIRKKRKKVDPTLAFYHRFLERMARAGRPKQAWETGREFAARLSREWPERSNLARQITEQYYQSRFSKS